MNSYWMIITGAALANNVVLGQFLGLCPVMGSSRRLDTASGLGLATVFVLITATLATHLADQWILRPFHLTHLRTLVFIGLIASVVQISERMMKTWSPRLFEALGIYLPLITTNCAVLGIALIDARNESSLLESIAFSAGSAIGFAGVLVLFSSMRERIELSDTPKPFKGPAIGLITAGIAALAFSGFSALGPS